MFESIINRRIGNFVSFPISYNKNCHDSYQFLLTKKFDFKLVIEYTDKLPASRKVY